jgi:hypothetical protein
MVERWFRTLRTGQEGKENESVCGTTASTARIPPRGERLVRAPNRKKRSENT